MAVFSNFPVTLPVMFSPTDTEYHPLHPLLCCAGKERGEFFVNTLISQQTNKGVLESAATFCELAAGRANQRPKLHALSSAHTRSWLVSGLVFLGYPRFLSLLECHIPHVHS